MRNKNSISKGKLNRMCKYFKNKEVEIVFEYNNSLGCHHIRRYEGKYDSFIITEFEMSSYKEWEVKFLYHDNVVFEEHFSYWSEFTGLGEIEYNNSGPYCYFSIKFVDSFCNRVFNSLKSLIGKKE